MSHRYEAPHALFGCQLKLDRAYEQVEALNGLIGGFLRRKPYEPVGKFDREAGEYFVLIRVRDDPPIQWSVLIGEVVHNLRSALDHLAWQLVKANGDTPNRDTGFPIFTQDPFADGTDERTLRRWERMTKGMHADDIAGIKGFQPYKRGNKVNSLFILNSLSNWDKHREMHFAQNILRYSKIDFENVRDCELRPAGKPHHGTFVDSTIVQHYRVIRTGEDPHVEMQTECAFDVAFAEPGPVAGFSVEETLIGLSNVVHDVVHGFAQQRFNDQETP
jgi:hypothetical protein